MKTDDDMAAEPEPGDQPDDRNELAHDRLLRAGQTAPPDRRITLLLAIALLLLIARAGGWSLLVVIAGLVVMIFLHELGHFVTAKLSGMKVTEFFLGFGPKLWSFRRGETEYGVKAIPAGAYVRIIGMNNLEEIPPEDESRTYRAQSYPRRLLVGVAGSGMHFIQALLCIFLLLAVTGVPGGNVFSEPPDHRKVESVSEGSAASRAGLQPEDKIVSIDGLDTSTMDKLRDALEPRAGKPVTVGVERNGQRFETSTTLGTDTEKGLLGVTLERVREPNERVGPLPAVGQTFTEFGIATRESILELGRFFSLSGLSDFFSKVVNGGSPAVDESSGTASPGSDAPAGDGNRPISIIGAARIGSDLTNEGLTGFLFFFATINLFIGIVNLAPLLPLDGGHVVIATYERIRSRRGRRYQVDVMKLLPLTYMVVLLLGLLFVSTVFLDLVDPIRLN